MPGAYTHITIARLLTEGNALRNLGLPMLARRALMDYSAFCRMGAISPDYPYLNLLGDSKSAEHWANSMHHKYGTLTTGNIFHIGINYIKRLTGDEQLKCLAWFLGYASHVTADVTCHPITNLLVGDYEADNQTAHRVSEMHQDVYIFKTRVNGNVRKSETIQNVIGSCTDPDDRQKVDQFIEKMWRHILTKVFPEIYHDFKLDIHGWHRAVQFFLDDIAEELAIIPSRHIRNLLNKEGVVYPRFREIKRKAYIDRLKTPKGRRTYDQIFDKAKNKVSTVWKLISNGVFLDNIAYKDKLKIWNLDTGQEVITPKVMWEGML
jgi:hypothetical protein